MIGLPTDFQHTAHIGSTDFELNNSAITALQNQMQSKGGYETSYASLKVRWNTNTGKCAKVAITIHHCLISLAFVLVAIV